MRLSLATALLVLATLGTVVALLAGAPAAVATAAVVNLAAGWAAARIVRAELVRTRLLHAGDRAALAREYRDVTAVRVAQNAEFAERMGDQLEQARATVVTLEGTVVLLETRVDETERSARAQRERAESAEAAVAALNERLAIRQAEEADELASWVAGQLDAHDGDGTADDDTIVDLLKWDERKSGALEVPEQRKQA